MWFMLGTEEHCVAVAALEMELFPDNCFNETTLKNELRAGARGAVIPEFEHLELGPRNRVKGYILSRRKNGLTDIIRVGVHPEFQRQGLGESLLRNELLGDDPFMLCVAKNNKPALSLYEKHGFIIEGEIGYGDDPRSHWVMARRLWT